MRHAPYHMPFLDPQRRSEAPPDFIYTSPSTLSKQRSHLCFSFSAWSRTAAHWSSPLLFKSSFNNSITSSWYGSSTLSCSSYYSSAHLSYFVFWFFSGSPSSEKETLQTISPFCNHWKCVRLAVHGLESKSILPAAKIKVFWMVEVMVGTYPVIQHDHITSGSQIAHFSWYSPGTGYSHFLCPLTLTAMCRCFHSSQSFSNWILLVWLEETRVSSAITWAS